MSDYEVEIRYDEDVLTDYVVRGAPNGPAAERCALNDFSPTEAVATPLDNLTASFAEHEIDYVEDPFWGDPAGRLLFDTLVQRGHDPEVVLKRMDEYGDTYGPFGDLISRFEDQMFPEQKGPPF